MSKKTDLKDIHLEHEEFRDTMDTLEFTMGRCNDGLKTFSATMESHRQRLLRVSKKLRATTAKMENNGL